MTELQTRLLDLFTLHQRHIRWILPCVCGLALVCAAGGLLWHFVSPSQPPDPTNGDLNAISDYIRGDAFLNASSRQRGEYVNQLMERYRTMPPAERENARDKFGSIFRTDEQTRKTFWLSFMQNQAEQYSKLSREKKKQRLDMFLTMGETMHGGRQRSQREFREKDPMSRQGRSEKRTKQSVDRFRKNLPFFLKQTSSSDRAKMVVMARDMMKRARERYDP
ncbi:MAG: hypothetical protein JW849_10875 [Phycisphaerae bacterium]|nr:hypothetical protein [Phycisphaerae bacterium]